MHEQDLWTTLQTRFANAEPGVEKGKMMSAEALTFQGKVFAFFSTKGGITGLGLRLGRDYDFASLGLTNWQHLAPFKTKPPMKDWIVVGFPDADRWPDLIRIAHDIAKTRKG